ncbi:hypothetical protein CAEBREN_13310 [Caenorhabditis brenneri]|uniref:Uncharacterized protein n=1 Tax=Caenorhabditis brenneri TaxID=135651 RepID=G0NWC1_CAEBE|nr:hypothetical protein CAEBREN_13310 [Caenorhabditis brenneri]
MVWLHVIHYAGFLFAQITNSILVYLIIMKAGKLFGSYRYVMCTFAMYSLIYAWIEVATQPYACFCTIVYCAYNIYRSMKNAQCHMSPKTLELNRQLFITLTFQTILPFMLMYTPVGLFITLPLFEVPVGKLGNIGSACLAVYPSLEPIVAIVCIKEFRRTVICYNKRKVQATYTLWSYVHFRISEFPNFEERFSRRIKMIWLHLVHYIGFAFAQCANSTLLYLILKKADRLFGSYRILMFSFAMYSLIYSWIEVFSQPIYHIKGPIVMVAIDGPLKNEAWLVKDLPSTYSFNFRLHMLYSRSLHWIICIVHFPVSRAVYIQICGREEILLCYGEDTRKLSFIAPMYWSIGEKGEKLWKISAFFAAAGCCSVIVSSHYSQLFVANNEYSRPFVRQL